MCEIVQSFGESLLVFLFLISSSFFLVYYPFITVTLTLSFSLFNAVKRSERERNSFHQFSNHDMSDNHDS